MTRHYLTIIFFSISVLISSLSHANNLYISDKHHDDFDRMLNSYVKDGVVDYTKFQQDPHFIDYIKFIANAKPRELETEKEQLAFWINAYNALSIKGIIDGKSPRTLLGRHGFFISKKHLVAGDSISLNTLEKKIIIPYKEPRIHFAIVCASISCPKLLSEAYTANKLEQQLQKNTIDFLNDKEKNKIEINNNKIKISKIFNWFKHDFIEAGGSIQKYISPFIHDESIRHKLTNNGFKVKYLKYNWNLNGIPPVKQ
jgi:hypothetical protein